MTFADPLPSWHDGAAKQSIVEFVQAVTTEGGVKFGLGLGVSLVTGLGVLSLVLEGAPIIWSLFWLIVPVVLVGYLLSSVGRQEFRR